MTNKIVHVIGGGTRFHIDSHLYLGSKAAGNTAKRLVELCRAHDKTMDVELTLTRMADPKSTIDTNEDLKDFAVKLIDDKRTKIVFFNAAVVDFDAKFRGVLTNWPMGKFAGRLRTKDPQGAPLTYDIGLAPSEKIVKLFRQGGKDTLGRKDIFLVAFKQTYAATPEEQYRQGLDMLKSVSANLVLANDAENRRNMIIVPEEATYAVTEDRDAALRELVEMAYLRSHLTFTRSTVVAGEPVPWESDLVPSALRTIVDHCIARGAYKRVRGVTAGHFAAKLDETTFLTSRRKTDFNDMKHVGLVKIQTDGPDSVLAYGGKPSVGGQSQRIVFTEHPDADCIVHFHCEMREGSAIPTVSQREYECGSHECGRNTSAGLARFGNLLAVYLDHHGPNIVFNKSIDPKEVIDFIEANFDLDTKTGGYQVA